MAGLTTTESRKEVTIEQMDYGYIDNCSNEKELERILRALRSGREGFYPELVEHCEKKLESINPQNRGLRKQQPILKPWNLEKEERQNLNNDMEKWKQEMDDFNESDPTVSNKPTQVNGFGDHSRLPPVRGSHIMKGNKSKKLETGEGKPSNPDRIKSYDYKAWDKFDVDKECDKIDTEAEITTPEKTTIELQNEIDASGLTDTEREIKAVREKEKGNEAFKSGDFEEALSYYSRSISLRPIAASYNNRALVNLRLEQWKDAKKDCNTVLSFDGEGENLKAMLRRATACKALGSYNEAKADLLFVLDKEPNNARAKSILADVEKMEAEKMKKKDEDSLVKDKSPPPTSTSKQGHRMVIQEVDGDSEEQEEEEDKMDSASSPVPPVSSPQASSPSSEDSNSKSEDVVESPDSQDRDSSKVSSMDLPKKDSTPPDESALTPSPVQEAVTSHPPSESESKPLKEQEIVENPVKSSQDLPPQEELKPIPPVEPKFTPIAEMLKSKAGDFFRSGNYVDACNHYTKAINSLSSLLKSKNVESGHELASAVLYNNRAVCWLKQGNDRACVDDCTKVLEIKTWDAKAFMRRAVAYEHMEKYSLAWADYQSAYSMDRDNALAQNGANRVAKHLKETHGMKWRDNVPKIHTYPHRNHAWVTQLPVQSTDPKKDDAPEIGNAVQTESIVVEKSPPKGEVKQTQMMGEDKKVTSEIGVSQPSVVPDVEKATKPKQAEKKTEIVTGGSKKSKKKRNKSKSKSPRKSAEEKKQEEEKQMAEKRLKIQRDLFEKLKLDGNEFVKKGNYTSAIDCYTRCLTLCPKETASYTNRALCFLKLKKHVSAVNDCTEAIKLDPVNVKAYYRRALARKAEGYYKEAERDIKKLLEIDPANKAANNELDALKKLAWDAVRSKSNPPKQQSNAKKDPPRKKQLVIEEVDSSSSSDEAEFILPREEPEDSRNDSPEAGELPPKHQENKDNLKTTEETTCLETAPKISKKIEILEDDSKDLKLSGEAVTEKSPSPASPKSETSADPPSKKEKLNQTPRFNNKSLTPYEFGNMWSSLTSKSDLNAYKDLLDQVSPENLPTLISNKIDDEVILVVARVSLEHVKSEEYQRAYDMMYHLTKAKRFSMAVMFLTGDQQKPLRSVFEALTPHVGRTFSNKDLENLQKLYFLC